MRPAADRTTSARASCPTTSVSASARERRLPVCRVSERSTCWRSTRDVITAGAREKSSIAAAVMAKAPASAVAFTWISSSRGTPGGAKATNVFTALAATAIPAAPPASASSEFSTNSWSTTRARLAPRAERTAISRMRARPRTSSRLATLMHVMSSRRAAAAAKTNNAGRVSPTMSRGSVLTTPRRVRDHGEAPGRRRYAVSSSRAASGVAPGASRAMRSISAWMESFADSVFPAGMMDAQKSVFRG